MAENVSMFYPSPAPDRSTPCALAFCQ